MQLNVAGLRAEAWDKNKHRLRKSWKSQEMWTVKMREDKGNL